MKNHRLLGATALCGIMFATSTAASAQTAPSTDPVNTAQATTPNNTTIDQTGVRPGENAFEAKTNAPDKDDTVVVTGSRLARPGIISQAPMTSITADELLSQSNINIGDALNDLPQLRSTYSQANSTRFIGTTGLNELDLRGLGTVRTLVLVNGRRTITSVPGTSIIDTNSIPMDLLKRVDVVTGGESALYGSDAIAGVVNFVLKQDYSGLKLNAQGGVSTYGDRGQEYVSAIYGKNFAEGRGNISISGEYSHAEAVYYRDRDFETGAYSGRHQFNLQENVIPEGNLPFASDGITDYGFYTGVRNGTISNGGILNAVCNTTALLANAARCRQNSAYVSYFGVASTTYVGQRYAFAPGGNLVLSNPTLDFRDITATGSTNTVGGAGSTLYETGMIAPRSDRYSINALAHYDFADALQVYFEGMFTKTVQNQEGQPSFFQGGTGGTFRCNNPFLNGQALTTLQSIGYCANVATGTFSDSRFNVDFGGRGELVRREIYRFVSGARGTFNDDWKYDVSVSFGEFNARQKSLNNVIVQNYYNAVNAVAAPATFTGSNFLLNSAGQKVICGINATTNVDPACYPLNTFGYGSPDSAALNYINTTARRVAFASQFDVNASISGDLSQLFSLPGGPIGFAFGGEYRRERAYTAFDALTASGATFLNAIQPFNPPNLIVKEGFGEIRIPILKDMRFAKELSISGAGRISNYNNSAGTVYSYNAGAIYAPADVIRFRGNYARAVRVPTQGDLYSPFSQNFAQLADPCDLNNIGIGPNRRANCTAAGVPAGFINTLANTQSTSYLSGGNPSLTAETSDSFTFGGVIVPRGLIPGVSLTIDYYNITVKNLISTLSAQTILNQCYDSSTGINNVYCQLIRRNSDSTFATNGIISAGVNFAKQKTSGIDIEYSYNHTFDSGDKLGLSVLGTWVAQRDNYVNPADPNYASRQKSNLGDPQFETRLTASYTHGPIEIGYRFQYIGRMTIAAYEAQNAFDGRSPTNLDAYSPVYYPAISYHNFRLAVNVNKQFQVYGQVDNAFNTLPPFGLFGNGANDGIYDPYGRTMSVGVKANF